jgi:putative tryptophan/tyrosine transport system substrate-binding protein
MIRRREFVAGLGSAVAWPLVARAQQAAMPVIGMLNVSGVPGVMERFLPAFNQGLADTGYVVGRNVTIESREGRDDQLPALAADLVRRQVAVIVTLSGKSALATKAATQTIPVVFGMADDPVEIGAVASLNRPSNNLTGVTSAVAELAGKRLELLHKLVPAADTIAYLGRTDLTEERANLQSAARVLGVRLLPLVGATESEIAAAFATIVEQRAGALLMTGAGTTLPVAAFDQIISLAGRYAVPTLFFTRDRVVSGGLASYGITTSDLTRQMGVYAGRILKGEKPADLPIVRPNKYELAINLKTATLTIPETLLATADEVIQ